MNLNLTDETSAQEGCHVVVDDKDEEFEGAKTTAEEVKALGRRPFFHLYIGLMIICVTAIPRRFWGLACSLALK